MMHHSQCDPKSAWALEVDTVLRAATEQPQDMEYMKGYRLAIEQVGHGEICCSDSPATELHGRVMDEDVIDNSESERPRKRWRRDSLTFEMIEACSTYFEVSCDLSTSEHCLSILHESLL